MVSVQLCNKHEYETSGELTECHLTRESSRLKPSPTFFITGLDPEKKYQVFLSFKQIGNFRKIRYNMLSNEPPEPFNVPNVEHKLGIASGQLYMDEIICFEGLKITNNIEAVDGRTVHLNSCHKYTPVLKIMEIDSQEVEKFSFDEASFRVGSTHIVKRTKEKRMTDEEDKENLVRRQWHGQALKVPVLSETKDAQSQIEGQDSPIVEKHESSSRNVQSLISVTFVNKKLFTKIGEITECRVIKKPCSLKPSPVFFVTGLDREKKYRVFLSFEQLGHLRKNAQKMLVNERQESFNEPNVEHTFGIASGEKFMGGAVSFEGLKVTSNIEAAEGRTMFVNSCHVYTPVLKVQDFDCQAAPLKFSFDDASFRVVTCFKKKRATEKRMADKEDKENQKKRQCSVSSPTSTSLPSPSSPYSPSSLTPIQPKSNDPSSSRIQQPYPTVPLPTDASSYNVPSPTISSSSIQSSLST